MLENPRSVPSYDDRLSALEDPALAERLLAENPELFCIRADAVAGAGTAAGTPVPRRRFRAVAIALIAAASLVAGYVLFPLLMKRPAPQPAVRRAVAGAPPKPSGQHEKPLQPIGTAPHEDATLRAELAKQQREIDELRAGIAAQAAAKREAQAAAAAAAARPAAPARPAPAVHALAPAVARPAKAAAPAPAQKYDSKPIWDVRPASKARTGTATSVSTSVSVATSTGTAAGSAADSADAAAEAPTMDAPMPDGTKGAPPAGGGIGHWNERGPYGVPAGGGTGNCSPSRDSVATGAGSILQRVGGSGRF